MPHDSDAKRFSTSKLRTGVALISRHISRAGAEGMRS